MRMLRPKVQIIFQDPYSSLNPRITVGDAIMEPLRVWNKGGKNNQERKQYVIDLMKEVGLDEEHYNRYPHEFSGGQRQRICIARALSVKPKLVICDEPVSALDVSIQAQIINLLKELQRDLNLTYLFISHDLSVVKFISDKIGVMYLGSMVEFGTKEDIFANPLHPYTKALLKSIPHPEHPKGEKLVGIDGAPPSLYQLPKGCPFAERCVFATEKCSEMMPEFKNYSETHKAKCLLDMTEGKVD